MSKIKKSVNELGRLRHGKKDGFKKESVWDSYFSEKNEPIYFPKKKRKK